MSGITLTDEYYLAHTVFNLTLHELHKLTLNAIKAAFMNLPDRVRFIEEVLEPRFTECLFIQSETDDEMSV